MYDITARDTFDSLASWISELDTFAGQAGRNVVRLIVGNKTDKEYQRAVSYEEGKAFAESREPKWMFMEASAKRGGDELGIDGLWGRVVDKVILLCPLLFS